MSRLAQFVWLGPRRLVVLAVRCYQLLLSPLLGAHCRYSPTCSSYFIQAVNKYGVLQGGWRGLRGSSAVIRSIREDSTRLEHQHRWQDG